MTTNEVLKLIDAGFTAEEIRKMDVPADAPASAPEPEPAPEPASDPEPAQPGLDQNAAIAAILNRMNDTLNRIQAANVLHDNTSSAGAEQSADDILQELIYPGQSK